MRVVWYLLALIVLAFWLTPLVAGLVDTLTWMLLNHGVTTINWWPWRAVVALFWTVIGVWVFGIPIIYFAEKGDES